MPSLPFFAFFLTATSANEWVRQRRNIKCANKTQHKGKLVEWNFQNSTVSYSSPLVVNIVGSIASICINFYFCAFFNLIIQLPCVYVQCLHSFTTAVPCICNIANCMLKWLFICLFDEGNVKVSEWERRNNNIIISKEFFLFLLASSRFEEMPKLAIQIHSN